MIAFLLEIYSWIVVATVLGSWLGPDKGVAQPVFDLLERLTEPVLAPIRRVLPPAGGFDLSPMVLLGLLYLGRMLLR